jgi:hypothetical protein
MSVNNRNNNNISRSSINYPASPPARRNVGTVDKSWNMNLASHAVVLYDYKRSTPTEISLGKSQVVVILDSKPGSEWWRVRDDMGREGYYPAHFLKII